ncbi:C-type lectin domain family 17, member A Prolectin [Channa argus]|uniref:C-type lectin domain family 17, member A Prolectin n=1 Tax=Channa argus TaxID=215402 RepID=A0A6G1QWS6_CHAAH|nr:C-type lectin domain family 17, member A Prolectin [Channa argus]
MSSNVPADEHVTVRYNQRAEGDGEVYEEKEVIIYDNADCVRGPQDNFQSQEGGPQTQNRPLFQRVSLRGPALCLGLLCLLMMAVIIILSIQNHLVNTSRLQDEIEKLKNKTKDCPEGWKRFVCSCYFKSTEKKTWSESRKFCQDRGSDLVMINSKEEQDFITDFNENEESWIGLRATESKTASTGYRWEWVDDSPLTETFWATAKLGNATGLNVASCCDQQGKWTRSGYKDNVYKNWICEK